MVKTIDVTTTDRLRRSPLYIDQSPSCARKRACMELTTICRFQRLKNPSFRLFQCFRRRLVATFGWNFSYFVGAGGVINSRQSACVGWVWGLLIVWGGEWGNWSGFGVIIRVKYGLQIVVGRVGRSYQQIVNNLWKMVWKLISKKVPKNLTFENRLGLTIYGLNPNKLGQ